MAETKQDVPETDKVKGDVVVKLTGVSDELWAEVQEAKRILAAIPVFYQPPILPTDDAKFIDGKIPTELQQIPKDLKSALAFWKRLYVFVRQTANAKAPHLELARKWLDVLNYLLAAVYLPVDSARYLAASNPDEEKEIGFLRYAGTQIELDFGKMKIDCLPIEWNTLRKTIKPIDATLASYVEALVTFVKAEFAAKTQKAATKLVKRIITGDRGGAFDPSQVGLVYLIGSSNVKALVNLLTANGQIALTYAVQFAAEGSSEDIEQKYSQPTTRKLTDKDSRPTPQPWGNARATFLTYYQSVAGAIKDNEGVKWAQDNGADAIPTREEKLVDAATKVVKDILMFARRAFESMPGNDDAYKAVFTETNIFDVANYPEKLQSDILGAYWALVDVFAERAASHPSPDPSGVEKAPAPAKPIRGITQSVRRWLVAPTTNPSHQNGIVIQHPVSDILPTLRHQAASSLKKEDKQDDAEIDLDFATMYAIDTANPSNYNIREFDMLFKHKVDSANRTMATHGVVSSFNGLSRVSDLVFEGVADTNVLFETMDRTNVMPEAPVRTRGITRLYAADIEIPAMSPVMWIEPPVVKLSTGKYAPAYCVKGQEPNRLFALLEPLDFYGNGASGLLRKMLEGSETDVNALIDDMETAAGTGFSCPDGGSMNQHAYDCVRAVDLKFRRLKERRVGRALSCGKNCSIDVAIGY